MSAETSNARGEWPERYACNGPEGTFWTNDAALAHKLIGAAFDRDEWTVTDTQNPTGAAPPTSAPGCGACADGCEGRGSCRVRDESPPSAPVGDGPDWRYAAVSAIEYIDAGDHDEARDILRSALDLSDEASAPSAPVGVEGLLADLETIWHSVSDDKETNAAYERLKVALAQQPGTEGRSDG